MLLFNFSVWLSSHPLTLRCWVT